MKFSLCLLSAWKTISCSPESWLNSVLCSLCCCRVFPVTGWDRLASWGAPEEAAGSYQPNPHPSTSTSSSSSTTTTTSTDPVLQPTQVWSHTVCSVHHQSVLLGYIFNVPLVQWNTNNSWSVFICHLSCLDDDSKLFTVLYLFISFIHSFTHTHSYSASMGSTYFSIRGAIWGSVSCPRTLRHGENWEWTTNR